MSIARPDVIYAEVKRERMTQLAYEAEPGPLLRTLLRLRHDLVIVGRAAAVPLPQDLQPRLGPPLERLVAALSGYPAVDSVQSHGAARRPPLMPPMRHFDDYAAEIAAFVVKVSCESCRAMPGAPTLGFAL